MAADLIHTYALHFPRPSYHKVDRTVLVIFEPFGDRTFSLCKKPSDSCPKSALYDCFLGVFSRSFPPQVVAATSKEIKWAVGKHLANVNGIPRKARIRVYSIDGTSTNHLQLVSSPIAERSRASSASVVDSLPSANNGDSTQSFGINPALDANKKIKIEVECIPSPICDEEKPQNRIQVGSRQDGRRKQQFTGGQEVWPYLGDDDRLEETRRGLEEDAEEPTCKTLRHRLVAGIGERFGRMGPRTATERPYRHKERHERSSDELGPPRPTLILRLCCNAWMVHPFHEKEGPGPETEDKNCAENACGFGG
ncbi:Cytokinesis protein sepA [Trichuris trichiura]|uniref:Cytokinesis protein sepA n=1 Tax=Trichuris trichiura TaxID=36087 RepID=A0A077ZFV7_TRITR|nr:Cytokinesis protein sepA [Trichuris trichiura]